MTFKGMLKILINDYRKQHEQKMFSLVQELLDTRRELKEVKEQLRALQLNTRKHSLQDSNTPVPCIRLFVQYNGFFNQLCDIPEDMTVEQLLHQLRRLTGIPTDRSIHIRVLAENGFKTICFIQNDINRTLRYYTDCLRPGMILNIEDIDDNSIKSPYESNRTGRYLQRSRSLNLTEHIYSFDESNV